MSAHSCATIKRLLRKGTRKGAEINYIPLTLVGLGVPCSVLNTRDFWAVTEGRSYF